MLIALMMGLPLTATAATPATTPDPAQVTVARSEFTTLTSSINGVTYKLSVFLPYGYRDGDRRYPVFYVTDGAGFGAQVANVTRTLSPIGEMPAVIVVGIDYADDEGHWLDLPTIEKDQRWNIPAQRGAANFLRVVTQEIKPFIDHRYRTDPQDSGIGGHSLGGFFALYALFHAPGTFRHVWSSSPSMIWSNAVLLKHEVALSRTASDLRARVFADAGGQEDANMTRPLQELTQAIGSRRYPSLRWKTLIPADENHQTVATAVLIQAMRFLYGTPRRTPDAAELSSLAGPYRLADGSSFVLQHSEGRLYLLGFGYEKSELVSHAADEWMIPYVRLRLSVQRERGRVAAVTIKRVASPGPGGDTPRPDLVATPVRLP